MLRSFLRSAIIAAAVVSLVSCNNGKILCEYDYTLLTSNREAIQSGLQCPAYEKLLESADKLLEQEPLSVTFKGLTPPSGDKHDYMSQAPYWWPDPDSPDGLPYIRKDGHINPEIKQLNDNTNLGTIAKGIHTLGLAYFFSSDEKYAKKATELARVWFIDPQTRMNPNLNFAQRVPGQCDGRGIGIIETGCLIPMVDGIMLIEGSRSWTRTLDNKMKAWCLAYRDWLLDSENGKDENTQPNNHGTSYDAQVLSLSLFTGSTERAISYMKKNVYRRFDEIRGDGVAPREMERATSWSYHGMNCRLLATLANIATKYGEDYFHYVNGNGVTFEKMFDFYDRIFSGELEWEGHNLSPIKNLGGYASGLMASAPHYWTEEQVCAKLEAGAAFCGKPLPDNAIEWLVFLPVK